MALWLPTNLSSGTLAGWYFLRDATGTLADGAKITQSGGSVSQWSDSSGANRHLVQATGSDQGAYSSAGLSTGHPGITFTGGSQGMRTATGMSYPSGIANIFVIGKTSNVSGGRIVSFIKSGGADYDSTGMILRASGPTQIVYENNGYTSYHDFSASAPILWEGYATSSSQAW